MCGIAGIIEFACGEKEISHSLLKAMSDIIYHRGPDDDGYFISSNQRCGFAFRRLSIIDLSKAGSQPMSTPDGRYTIVFNGEIYNHSKIRAELESLGWRYKSRTDTETILYGYAQWGEAILDKMLGMWAFAIWDDNKQELFAARDRIGIKPLYFYNKEGRFAFGSEIKSIFQHPKISRELNFDELPNYLNFGMSGKNGTLFKNIFKLPAGHCLKLNKNGDLNVKRWWSFLKKDDEYISLSQSEIQKEIVRLLRQAVEDRMMSDVPFGVFLSGGIDSSLNVALMSELMDRPVDTYTVGFKELEKYNELDYARQVAKLYKTNHHEILIDHSDCFNILEKLAFFEDEPNGDPVCMPLYFLSKLTRDSGTIVIQVGEGSDEQFVGYPWMLTQYKFYKTWWKAFGKLPAPIRKAIYYSAKPLFESAGQLLALDLLRRNAFGQELYWSGMSIFSPSHLLGLFSKDFRDDFANKNSDKDITSIPAEYATSLHAEAMSLKPDSDYLQRMFYTEFTNRLAEILLMRVDKIGMAHSIEARVPFLDHRLVEFTARLSPQSKLPDGKTTKYLLKKAIEEILPHNIIYRRKQGFWAPVNEWLADPWREFAENKIKSSELSKLGIFSDNYIESLFARHDKTRKHGFPIFNLLMLHIWYDSNFS